MALIRRRLLKQMLNLGYGTEIVPADSGGTQSGDKIGIHTLMGDAYISAHSMTGSTADEQIGNAIAVIDSLGGGTVDALGLTGTQQLASTVNIPAGVRLLLGAATYICSQADGAFTLEVDTYNSAQIIGVGPNTILNYTGSGHAIDVSGDGETATNLVIADLSIRGSSGGESGVHLSAFNHGSVRNVTVSGFTGTDKAGFLNEGCNAIAFYNCTARDNTHGLHNVGVVVNSSNYSVNALTWHGGQILANVGWGIWEDGAESTTVGANTGNAYFGVTIQDNGVTSSGTTGNVFLQQAFGCKLIGCYLEYAAVIPTSNVVVGDATYTPQGNQLISNVFLSNGTNSIYNVRSTNLSVLFNQESSACTNFVNNSANGVNPIVAWNSAPSVSAYITGSDTGVPIVAPAVSTFINGITASTRGLAFNTITGNSATTGLAIRNNNVATNTVTFQKADQTTVGAVTNLGLATWARMDTRQGTAHIAGDWSLSSGFGSTASVSGINATDGGGSVVIASAGVGQAANPTATLTFKDGAFSTAVLFVTTRTDTDQPTIQFLHKTSNTTSVQLVFKGTPVAGESYGFNFFAVPAKA